MKAARTSFEIFTGLSGTPSPISYKRRRWKPQLDRFFQTFFRHTFSLSRKSTVRPCLSTAGYRLGPPAFDLYIRLLASPGPAYWSGVSAPTLLEHWHISLNPAQNRCVYQTHAPLSHYFHQVAQTQLVRDIPADAEDNHHSVKLTALEQCPISGLHFHSRYYRRPSNFAPEPKDLPCAW